MQEQLFGICYFQRAELAESGLERKAQLASLA